MERAGAGGKSKEDHNPKRRDRRCYKCNELGHIVSNCPSLHVCDNCGEDLKKQMYNVTKVTHKGEVEGAPVDDITLDMGSARTMINSKMVPDNVEITGRVPIRCAHGDVRVYPLAQMEVRIGERSLLVEAAMSSTLPVSVLVGRDAPELLDILSEPDSTEDMLAVLIRAQARQQQEEEDKLEEGDRLLGACPRAMIDESPADNPLGWDGPVERPLDAEDTLPFCLEPVLFQPAKLRVRKSRRAKREGRRAYRNWEVQSRSKK